MGQLAQVKKLGPLYRVAYVVLTPLLTPLTRVRFSGESNLPEGGFILVQNHLSNLDPLTVAYQLGIRGREVRFLAKSELFKVPVLGGLLTRWGMVPVERHTGNAARALEEAASALGGGRIIAVYPEGTITKDPAFWPMKMKTGVARIALASGKPVVPIAQWGTQDVLDRSATLPRFRRTTVLMAALPAVDLSDLPQDPQNREAVEQAMLRISTALRQGVEQLRGEEAPDAVWDPKEHDIPKKSWGPFSSWRRQLASSTGRQDILPGRP